MKRNQSGFTLIEIAIVLVIIGLLLGGVLKGQELINSAKVKNLAGDFRNIPVMIYGYQDKYRALPGDDIAVVAHASGVLATSPGTAGNGVIEGQWTSDTPTDESYLFWQHIRLAGLATGSTTMDCQPILQLPTLRVLMSFAPAAFWENLPSSLISQWMTAIQRPAQ
jgi:prepilin-type N-terminal cleavage/methylation domain-containing protein